MLAHCNILHFKSKWVFPGQQINIMKGTRIIALRYLVVLLLQINKYVVHVRPWIWLKHMHQLEHLQFCVRFKHHHRRGCCQI
ncbi:hypothetical protein T05_5139 [Trichinella murrelli]|uniref:Uncharacterized protein n=1 Tax=Trichinella murrelli TaxID=144512 RepID=A0A0V0TH40_9BILA|nr:hypothetical protein T05_5139 [Trichinella murrelli]